MSNSFVHLHLHSQYSLLDGAIKPDDLVNRAKEFGMDAVAITDHGNLFGAYEFYEKAKVSGIKPIIGCEIYVTPTLKLEKPSDGKNFHLTLLCMNEIGYKNLSQLVTKGYFEGFYRRPRVDHELLDTHKEGLIVLSGCMSSEIASALFKKDRTEAAVIASKYHEIFSDRYYLEIQATGMREQNFINSELKKISDKLGIPLIATNDCHFLKQEDAMPHDALLCIQTGAKLSDSKRMRFANDQFFLKSRQQMEETLQNYQDALDRTVEVANRCNFEFKTEGYKFPEFKPPKGMTLDEHIKALASEKLNEFIETESIPSDQVKTYRERLDSEVDTICQMGFTAYFLIVADFINYAKSMSIPVGPGRGSAAGSLVAYVLGITDIDPIPYNLIFERFLNPERVNMPDIDIDFCTEGREKVIEYVSEKYGRDKVAQIGTFGTMSSKAVIKDVSRVLDVPYADADRLSKLIPSFRGKVASLSESLKKVSQFKDMIGKSEQLKELMKLAKPLENMVRHASTHAAGIVVSNEPISDYIPLYKGSKNEIVTQFDMDCIEKLGYVKFDFLGLKTLTVIDKVLKYVNEPLSDPDEKIDIKKIPLDDKKVYKLLVSDNTRGIFQIESKGMKELLKRLKPSAFEDIIALLALYRPGPLDSGMVDDFVKIKNGKQKIKYPHPKLEEILKDTYGLFVYQEQIMQTASEIAGYTLGEADILRRAMGKKKPKEMKAQRERFVTGAIDNSISERKATELFDTMEKFAEYSFNKSHSTAYAMITYQTAYTKAHYPTEFMASLMTNEHQNTDKIISCITECRKMNIDVLAPDVNESMSEFTPVEGKIRFGLSAIKNVGGNTVSAIIGSREKDGPFESIFDFCSRVDSKKLTRKTFESLIKSGVFDSLEPNRAKLINSLESLISFNAAKHQSSLEGQHALFEIDSTIFLPSLQDVDKWDMKTMLTNEMEVLGFYVTSHPMSKYTSELEIYTSKCDSETIASQKSKKQVTIAGIVRSLKEKRTKNGSGIYANMVLEDLKGSVEVILFNDILRRSKAILEEKVEPIIVEGFVDPSEERAKIKASKIYSLNHIRSKNCLLHINLDRQNANIEVMNRLKKAFTLNPGQSKIHIHLDNNGQKAVIEVGNCKVNTDEEFVRTIEDIIGKGEVKLAY